MTRRKDKRIKRKQVTKAKTKRKVINKPTPPNDDITLRNMLLMKSGMLPTGYNSQQYGNINNERNISNLQNSNQIIQQKLQSDAQTIASLTNENKKLKQEAKARKKEYERAQLEHDKVESELEEGTRIEGQMELLKTKTRNVKQRLNETIADNHIQELKVQREQLLDKLEQQQDLNNSLKHQVDENVLFHELSKNQRELDKIVAENQTLQATINSDDFQNPLASNIESMKQLHKAKYEQELLMKQQELQQKNYQLNVEKEAQLSASDMKDISDKHDKAIQEQLAAQVKLQEDIYAAQAPIRTYNIQKENLEELQKAVSKLRIDQLAASRQATQLLQQNNYGIGDIITKEAQEQGRLRGDIDKTNSTIRRRQEIRAMTIKKTELEAEAEELAKDLSNEETKLINEAAIKKTEAEQASTKVKTAKDVQKSKRDLQEAQSAYAFVDSDKYKAGNNELIKMKLEYMQNTKKKEMMLDMLEEHRKKQQAMNDRRVTEKMQLDYNDVSHIQQINAYDKQIELLAKKEENLINIAADENVERQYIIDELGRMERSKVRQKRHATIPDFFKDYPSYNPTGGDYQLLPLNTLRQVKKAYSDWMPTPSWSTSSDDWANDYDKNIPIDKEEMFNEWGVC